LKSSGKRNTSNTDANKNLSIDFIKAPCNFVYMTMTSNHLHLRVLKPENVIPHLGSESHWKEGRSGRLTAETWFASRGLPQAIADILATSDRFKGAELIDAFLERSVELGDGGRASQTDVMAIVGISDRLAIVAVEAKVDEPFGPLVHEWLAEGASNADGGAGKSSRLDLLCNLLGLSRDAAMPLRYQLLHRTASAIIEAKRYRTKLAAMVVQSFCPDRSWLADFQSFGAAMGFAHVEPGTLSVVLEIGGVELALGWVAET
jgi:hypothetical protein